MLSRRTRLLAAAVAASLTLTACGRAGLTAARPGAASAVRAASAADAKAKADRFASLIRKSFKGDVTVVKAVVTLQAADQAPVRYDFTRTPATGLVVVSIDGYETTVSEAKLLESADRLPQIVVTIAIQMLLGGAKALVVYYIKHPKDFDKKEATRAVLIGMGTALVHFLPHGAALDALVPMVVDMLMKIEKKDIKHVAEVFMAQVDKVADWVKEHVLPHLNDEALVLPTAQSPVLR
jgi:hypothetical protein